MNLQFFDLLLSIAVALLVIVSFLSGAMQSAWRKLRHQQTPLEELRDQIARSTKAAEETLEIRRSEAKAQKVASVHVVKFKNTIDGTANKTDPLGIQLQNGGPAIAFNVWAEVQLERSGTVERSDTISQLGVDQIRGLVCRNQFGELAPDRGFSETQVQLRFGWEDDRGGHTSDWDVYRRE